MTVNQKRIERFLQHPECKWIKILLAAPVLTKVRKKVVPSDPIMDGSENYLDTGCKAYYRGGGWWTIAGYYDDGRDVIETLKRLDLLSLPTRTSFDDILARRQQT